jgi:hypothetical protein
MSAQVPASQWPEPYGAEEAPREVDRGRIWGIATLSGVLAYGAMVAIHLSTNASLSPYEAGRLMPVAVVSALLVAFIAQSTSSRTWSWWQISGSVLALSSVWYVVIVLAPQLTNDARAEVTGQDGYVLGTPATAGSWARDDGAGPERREAQALGQLANGQEGLPEMAVYAEYTRGAESRLVLFGFNAAGELEDDLRESSKGAVEQYLLGAGARDYAWVKEGDLGGSMACSGDASTLPAGVILCAWADSSTLAQVVVSEPHLDVEGAAGITRTLRQHVTRR